MKRRTNLVVALVGTALLSSICTYVVLQDKLTSNHPLSLDQQLSADDLTLTNDLLLKDIIQPAFGDVALVGVNTTNSCSAFEKGCFGNREMSEKEFANYTGRGPQISLLVYQTPPPGFHPSGVHNGCT